MSNRFLLIACVMLMSISQSCRTAEHMSGESLVLAGQTPGLLLADKIDARSVVVRSTYLPGGTRYEPERDYHFDPATRSIARSPESRIPDFSTNILFGKKDFDQGQFPGYGNGKFEVFVDYNFAKPLNLTEPKDVSALLPKTVEKLHAGKALKVIAFGDSITAGGEASSVALQYPSRYVEYLKQQFPTAPIMLENTATGGDNTINGLQRLDEKVLTRKPDLVLVAFGMNDCNLPGVGGVPIPDFKQNLKTIVQQIRDKTGAEVILISAFPPNPMWHYSSHQMEKYAQATKEAADESHAPYADVFDVWKKVLERKDPPSMLGNNINHPNDFGHGLYLLALEALKF